MLELYDYGESVTLDPPPDDEVVELRELTEQLDRLERDLPGGEGTEDTEER